MAIWYILWSFGIFSPHLGILYKEKSGNPSLGDRLLWVVLMKNTESLQIIGLLFPR
jgi:hypothetical protein